MTIFSCVDMLPSLRHMLQGWPVWLVLISVRSLWLPLLNALRYIVHEQNNEVN